MQTQYITDGGRDLIVDKREDKHYTIYIRRLVCLTLEKS